jgi:hypothetical protein
MPDQKLHRSRPRFLGRISILFVQDRHCRRQNILFFYFFGRGDASRGRLVGLVGRVFGNRRGRNGRRDAAGHGRTPIAAALRQTDVGKLRPRLKSGVQRQQPVEFGRLVPDAIGPGDEDVPAFFRQGPPLGDRDDDAQPNRRRGLFSP